MGVTNAIRWGKASPAGGSDKQTWHRERRISLTKSTGRMRPPWRRGAEDFSAATHLYGTLSMGIFSPRMVRSSTILFMALT